MKRWLKILAGFVVAPFLLCGCQPIVGSSMSSSSSIDPTQAVYAYVGNAQTEQSPYQAQVWNGFQEACAELGVRAVNAGPYQSLAKAQIVLIEDLIQQGVSVIAVDACDYNSLKDVLQRAMDAGITVISLGTPVDPDSRMLHVGEATWKDASLALLDSAYSLLDGEGGIGVFASQPADTEKNFYTWWLQQAMDEDPEKYADLSVVALEYSNRLRGPAQASAQALLENPKVDLLLCWDQVGLLEAANYISENGLDTKLIGLSIPSVAAPYIEDGIIQECFLWNPVDIGYLGAYTAAALDTGEIAGKDGDIVPAGRLGERVVLTSDSQQGYFGQGYDNTEAGDIVYVETLQKFDQSNIHTWKKIY